MANTERKILLLCVCILFATRTEVVCDDGSTLPQNMAVYEGTQNTELAWGSLTEVSYFLKATTEEMTTRIIASYEDYIDPSLRDLFDVTPNGLLVKLAQSTAEKPPTSTAGLYIIKYPDSTKKAGAKLIVVQKGPTCSCWPLNSSRTQLNCTFIYGDSTFHPIDARLTWVSGGRLLKQEIPPRKRVEPHFVATSSITVDASDPANYRCIVTFEKPRDSNQFSFVATNAPEFTESCSTAECRSAPTVP